MKVTPDEFDACFSRFTVSVWRLEALQQYTIDEEQERIRAWRDGLPRPERSVRTSPWLRRIALSSVGGKEWGRVHVVDHPLSEYVRYEIGGYIESAAVGEAIGIADRSGYPELADPGPDFWLFDEDTPGAFAIMMSYDSDGRWLGAEHTADPVVLGQCREVKAAVTAAAVPLNVYLARIGAGDILRNAA